MARPGKVEVCAAAAVAFTLLLSACSGGGGETAAPPGSETPGTSHVTAACKAPAVTGYPAPKVAPKTPATAPAAGTPVVGGSFTDLQDLAVGAQDHIEPATASTLQGAQISTLLYDGLTEYDFSNKDKPVVKPQIAESFSSNDKADVWTFKLRKDATFSDGTPIAANDFKCAWEQVLNPDLASELTYILDNIKGAKAFGEGKAPDLEGVVADDAAGTLTVTLEKPFADFAGVVSHPVFSPKPRAEVAKQATAADWEKGLMIGNGPFKMTKPWSSEDQEIVLERNDKYDGGIDGHLAYLDKVTFKVSKDVDSAYTDFEAGNAQTGFIPSGKFKEATGKYPHATDPNLGAYFFAFNQENATVGGEKNLKLRQAISLAIDRQAINEAVYNGSRRLPTGLTPPGLPGFKSGLCDHCPETAKVDEAKKLVADWQAAGGSVTEPIKIQFNAGSGHEDVVNLFVANLAAIGIPAVPDPHDTKTYFKEMRQGACVICRAGWIWDYPLYDNGVYAEMDSRSIDGDNLARLNDPELDKLIDQARSTTDADKRAEYYQQAEKRGLDQLAVMPVNWYAGQIVYTDKVMNLVESPLQFVLYQNIWLKS